MPPSRFALRSLKVDTNLPNIYMASVSSPLAKNTIHLYIAADFTGAAIRKVTNLVADRHGFRPYRSNAVIKLRRLRVADYATHPSALTEALQNAHSLGERDTLRRLADRPAQIRKALAASAAAPEQIDAQVVWEALCRAVSEADAEKVA